MDRVVPGRDSKLSFKKSLEKGSATTATTGTQANTSQMGIQEEGRARWINKIQA